MGKAVFNTGSRAVNRIDRCGCGARKLALDKRCVKCQIKRKAETNEALTECHELDRWEAVETFMEGVK